MRTLSSKANGTKFRVPEGMKEPLRRRLYETGLSFQSTVQQLLEAYLAVDQSALPTVGAAPPPPPPSTGSEDLINSLHLIASQSAQVAKAAANLISNIEGGRGDAAAIAGRAVSGGHATADRVDAALGGGSGSPGQVEGRGIPSTDGDRAGKPGKPKKRT